MKSAVSLVIPLYNKLHCIKELAEKIKAMSSKFYEVIVVDDCSTDGSLNVLREGLAGISNVVLLELSHNVGPFSARITGIQRSKTEWVQMLDADDDLLKSFSSMIDDLSIEGHISDEIVAIGYKEKIKSISRVGVYDIPRKGWPNCSNIIVRKSSCETLSETRRLMWGEDHVLFCKLFARGKMLYIPGRLANYRKEFAERSATNGSIRNRLKCANDMHRALKEKTICQAFFVYLFFTPRTIAAFIYKKIVCAL